MTLFRSVLISSRSRSLRTNGETAFPVPRPQPNRCHRDIQICLRSRDQKSMGCPLPVSSTWFHAYQQRFFLHRLLSTARFTTRYQHIIIIMAGPDEHTPQTDQADEKDSPPERLWYIATITHLCQLTPTVTGVTIDVDIDAPLLTSDQGASWQPVVNPSKAFAFLPGQWVDFYIPAIKKVGGYSIVSLPSHLPRLELAVKRSRHPPADWVTSKAKVGDSVKVRVGGEFVYSTSSGGEGLQIVDGGACMVPAPDSKGLLFVAGGVGINPLYGMIRQLHSDLAKAQSTTQGPKAILLYSASKADELLFEPELTDMAKEFPNNFHMVYHVTRDDEKGSEEDSSATYRRGRITNGEIGEALQWAASSIGNGKAMIPISSVYICGPTGFAEEMSEACQEHGVPKSAIRFEQWW